MWYDAHILSLVEDPWVGTASAGKLIVSVVVVAFVTVLEGICTSLEGTCIGIQVQVPISQAGLAEQSASRVGAQFAALDRGTVYLVDALAFA